MAMRDLYLSALVQRVASLFTGGSAPVGDPVMDAERGRYAPARTGAFGDVASGDDSPGRGGVTATREIAPPPSSGLIITYAPERDGDPDAGEIVWTWVPYAENDGRGKDRPVLVIARESADRVYAVRLTSKAHEADRDFLSIGSGPWDAQGRSSWLDIEQVYSVHREGMRREASELDPVRFARVAEALGRRYGWGVGA